MTASTTLPNPSTTPSSDDTAAKQRKIQSQQDERDAKQKQDASQKSSGSGQVAPGPGRDEPAPPLPRLHLEKPGVEADLQLEPRYDAPHYHGSGKLHGMSARPWRRTPSR